METQVTIKANVDPSIKEEIKKIAEATKQTEEEVISETLAMRANYERWFNSRIEQGLLDSEQGRTRPFEEVMQEIAVKIGYKTKSGN